MCGPNETSHDANRTTLAYVCGSAQTLILPSFIFSMLKRVLATLVRHHQSVKSSLQNDFVEHDLVMAVSPASSTFHYSAIVVC